MPDSARPHDPGHRSEEGLAGNHPGAFPAPGRETGRPFPEPPAGELQRLLSAQRAACLDEGPPPAGRRIAWLDRAIALLHDHQKEIVEAISADFGHRSAEQTLLADVMGSIVSLQHARRHVRNWMRGERRRTGFPLGWLGARSRLLYQPKGVVGLVGPWNFPVNLTMAPLAGVMAAGNRAMIKPSEHTPVASALLARLFREHYDETEFAVITGDAEVGAAFSRLPFDHLVFTGGTAVARHVMRAAADHLVPLTLELGGKSPVIVSRSADLPDAVAKILAGKLFNAGQVCLAPDYVFLPRERIDAFVAEAGRAVAALYPSLRDNPDYTSVLPRHHARLLALLEDARDRGARVHEINPAGEDFRIQPFHKIPPTLVLDAPPSARILQEEIFGPLLPLLPYEDVSEAVDWINARDRPLALYYFGKDRAEEDRVLSRTLSGGVTLNDVLMHVAVENLPLGGVGASGMGSYHGRDGFLEFSHARAVFRQSALRLVTERFRPPYTETTRKRLALMAGWRRRPPA